MAIKENGNRMEKCLHLDDMVLDDVRNEMLFKKFESAYVQTFNSFALALKKNDKARNRLFSDYDTLRFARCDDGFRLLPYGIDEHYYKSLSEFLFLVPDDYSMNDNMRFLSNRVIDIATVKSGLPKDDFISKFVDDDLLDDICDSYDDNDPIRHIFDEKGNFDSDNMHRLLPWRCGACDYINDIRFEELVSAAPGSLDSISVNFVNGHNSSIRDFEVELDNAIKAGKLSFGHYNDCLNGHNRDVLEYEDYLAQKVAMERSWPSAHSISARVCLRGDCFELAGLSVQFSDHSAFDIKPDLLCKDCFDLSKFSEREKMGILSRALYVAYEKSGLSKYELGDKLIDQGSEYAKLKLASFDDMDSVDAIDDFGIGDD